MHHEVTFAHHRHTAASINDIIEEIFKYLKVIMRRIIGIILQ